MVKDNTTHPKQSSKKPKVVAVPVAIVEERHPNVRKAIIALIIVLTAYLAVSFVTAYRGPSEPVKQAVKKSEMTAQTFKKDDIGYSISQLTTAIQLAENGKCPESKAVVAEVRKHPNGLQKFDIEGTEQRISKLCK